MQLGAQARGSPISEEQSITEPAQQELSGSVRKRGSRPQEEKPPPPAIPLRPQLPSPINWWKLDDEERAETLEVLGEWVPELVRRYGLRDSVVPPCWYLHESLVQELLAIFQYRNQQQVLETAPPSAMLDFHYQFDIAIRRLHGWTALTGCNSADHRDTTLPLWVVPGTVQGSQWGADFEEHVDLIRGATAGTKE